jgi:hypothetical protein
MPFVRNGTARSLRYGKADRTRCIDSEYANAGAVNFDSVAVDHGCLTDQVVGECCAAEGEREDGEGKSRERGTLRLGVATIIYSRCSLDDAIFSGLPFSIRSFRAQ